MKTLLKAVALLAGMLLVVAVVSANASEPKKKADAGTAAATDAGAPAPKYFPATKAAPLPFDREEPAAQQQKAKP